jgi:hypothetical protein
MRDDQLTQLLRQIDAPAYPDSEFADRLFEDLSRQTSRPTGMRMTLLLVAAVMLVAVLAMGAAVGSGLVKLPWFSVEVSPAPSGVAVASESAAPSLTPSATPAASPSRSPAPLPVVTPPPGILLPPGSKATVSVDQLNVRQDPSTSAPLIATFKSGDPVTILHSIVQPLPVSAGGISWYEIELASSGSKPCSQPCSQPYGWVAAGDGSTEFLALAEPATCGDLVPGPVTLQKLISADSWHRLACLGDAAVTVTGVYVQGCQGGAADPNSYGPGWLIDWCATQLLMPQESARNGAGPTRALDTVHAPGSGLAFEPIGTIARVTGHFDDPASETCFMRFGGLPDNYANGAAALDCREQFVVTKIEVLGTMTLPPL